MNNSSEISKNKKTIVFIINPVSGGINKKNISELIRKEIDENLFDLNIVFTEYAGHASEISKQLVENNTNIIVAVGGDGTINEVATQMINSNSTLGIIPMGSGNGLARHLNISRTPAKALKLINTAKNTKIDTATINDKAFISIAGVGFDATVADIFTKSKKRGFFSYFKIIAETFQSYRPKKYTLVIDGKEEITTKALFISFANSNQFGYNTSIAPNAKLNDGKLDICIVQKPKIFEIPLIANLLLLKKIHHSPHVKIITASKLSVTQSINRVVNLDGEAIILDKELIINVLPLSLKIIIP